MKIDGWGIKMANLNCIKVRSAFSLMWPTFPNVTNISLMLVTLGKKQIWLFISILEQLSMNKLKESLWQCIWTEHVLMIRLISKHNLSLCGYIRNTTAIAKWNRTRCSGYSLSGYVIQQIQFKWKVDFLNDLVTMCGHKLHYSFIRHLVCVCRLDACVEGVYIYIWSIYIHRERGMDRESESGGGWKIRHTEGDNVHYGRILR